MTTQGLPLRSAYLICDFMPDSPSTISSLMFAAIKLGANVCRAKILRHLLVVGDAVAVEHEHDDRALRCRVFVFAKALEAEQETRHANGDAGGWDLLAGEALDKPIIAPAADHRPEPDGLALVARDWRGQLSLEHRSGIVLQPTDDGGIHPDPIGIASAIN